MSIPAAGSAELIGEAVLALTQWWQRHLPGRIAKPRLRDEGQARRADFDSAMRSPFASSILVSDTIQTCCLDASDERSPK